MYILGKNRSGILTARLNLVLLDVTCQVVTLDFSFLAMELLTVPLNQVLFDVTCQVVTLDFCGRFQSVIDIS